MLLNVFLFLWILEMSPEVAVSPSLALEISSVPCFRNIKTSHSLQYYSYHEYIC